MYGAGTVAKAMPKRWNWRFLWYQQQQRQLVLIEHILRALQHAVHVRLLAWLFARVYNHNNAFKIKTR